MILEWPAAPRPTQINEPLSGADEMATFRTKARVIVSKRAIFKAMKISGPDNEWMDFYLKSEVLKKKNTIFCTYFFVCFKMGVDCTFR